MWYDWKLLNRSGQEVLKEIFFNSTTTGQTPSDDEDHVMWLKAPDQLLDGHCGEEVFSIKTSGDD